MPRLNAAGRFTLVAMAFPLIAAIDDAHAQRGGQHLNSPGYQRALQESRRKPPPVVSKQAPKKPSQMEDERQQRRCGGSPLCINPVF